jgi:hypothetical protein
MIAASGLGGLVLFVAYLLRALISLAAVGVWGVAIAVAVLVCGWLAYEALVKFQKKPGDDVATPAETGKPANLKGPHLPADS